MFVGFTTDNPFQCQSFISQSIRLDLFIFWQRFDGWIYWLQLLDRFCAEFHQVDNLSESNTYGFIKQQLLAFFADLHRRNHLAKFHAQRFL